LSEIQDACRLVGLARVYGKGATAHHALDQIDLSIKANEFFTLLGPSGCGKTTLLRLIGGFDQPTSGQIAIFGARCGRVAPRGSSGEYGVSALCTVSASDRGAEHRLCPAHAGAGQRPRSR
jgi:ABC-type glutathione transport system ATPase component